MKKKILFICASMDKGGVSKSLVSLLNCIDFRAYDVDLYLFEKKGIFMNQIPKEVHVLSENKGFKYHLMKGKIFSIIRSYITYIIIRNEKNLEKKWGLYWKSNKALFSKNDTYYDVAVSYNDGVELYYLVDCIRAKTKIGYNHTEYSNNLTFKPGLDIKYYNQIDYLVTVSNICYAKLAELFPQFKSKIYVIENIVQKEIILKLGGKNDCFQTILNNRKEYAVIVTVAGLYKRKGFDIASEALSLLKKKNYKFKWFIIGDGPDREEIKRIIESDGISGDTTFLLQQENPYKFVKWADIFLLTSYAEGKSIAIEEAKLLEKPIVITNFSSAKDQIIHQTNGLVADLNSQSIEENLEVLINNPKLRSKLTKHLRKNTKSNVEENLKKMYFLFK